MDLTMITPEAWEAFMKKYPTAYQFLLENALQTEKKLLEAELDNIRNGWLQDARRRVWVEERLEQLKMITATDFIPRH